MPDYLTVTCRLPAAAEGQLAEALGHWPVLGCQVEDSAGELDVTIYLEETQSAAVSRVLADLGVLGAREVGSAHFAEEDWLAEYRRSATPIAIGSTFWIDPHPTSPTPAPEGRIHLIIEPRQAFGTGSHESTRLVLLLLEELPVAGARVLDVGTGSGILALAARALGARWAVGFDIDDEAVFVARQIQAEQPQRMTVALFAGSSGSLRRRRRFDLVLANMIPAQFEPLLEDLIAMLDAGGRLVLSGLMIDQRAAVESELDRLGMRVTVAKEQGEWLAMVCEKQGRG